MSWWSRSSLVNHPVPGHDMTNRSFIYAETYSINGVNTAWIAGAADSGNVTYPRVSNFGDGTWMVI